MIKKINSILLIIVLIFGICIVPSVSMAAKTTLSASSKTVNSGEEFSISISSSVALSGWTISLSSNGGCTFVSASGGEVNGSKVYGTSSSGTSSLATYKFKAPEVSSDTKYTIKFSGTDMCDQDTNEIDSATATATITVKAKTTTNNGGSTNNNGGSTTTGNNDKELPNEPTPVTSTLSQDNTLKALSVDVGTLSPKFSSRTTKYTVDVGEDVTSITISATKNHSKATVSGTGKKDLNPGVNVFNISVKAENGSTQQYTITVNKPEQKKEQELKLSSLVVKGVNENRELVDLIYTPEFAEDVYSYSMEVGEDIESVTIEANPKEEGTIVEILGNEDLTAGENIINIIVKSEDGEKTANYQLIVNKAEKTEQTNATVEIPQDVSKSDHWIGKYCIPIVIVTSIIALLGIIFAVIEYRYSKNKKASEEDNVEDSRQESIVENKNEDVQEENKSENIEKENINNMTEDNNIEQSKKKGRGKHF